MFGTLRTAASPRSFVRSLSVLVLLLSAFVLPVQALTFNDTYRSPRNKERPIRKATRLIVLHTTEAHAKSSLNKLSERGEAHYCIPEDGTVYRIVDREREAFHAGRSMWNGKSDCDAFSIGIEVVGHHDQAVTLQQLSAMKDLIARLQKIYGLKDAQVVCHSHVAYGAPNKWQKQKHRGRKRCGMLFAMPSVRAQLGLSSRPAIDPDVKAHRLVQADGYLANVLYGSVDTMSARYSRKRPQTVVAKANPPRVTVPSVPKKGPPKEAENPTADDDGIVSNIAGFFKRRATVIYPDEPKPIDRTASTVKVASPTPPAPARATLSVPPVSAKATSPGCRTIGVDGYTYNDLGGKDPYSENVFYILPDGTYGKGSAVSQTTASKFPKGTRVLLGYRLGGPIDLNNGAMRICGRAWKQPTTYYLSGRTFVSGDKIDERQIKKGTLVFWRQ